MITKRILWQAPDGSILVTTPLEPMLPGEDEAGYLERVAAKAMTCDARLATCQRLPDVDAAELPANRRWRNQWRATGRTIAPDVALCRQQRAEEIRKDADRRRMAVPARLEQDIAGLRTLEEIEAYQA